MTFTCLKSSLVLSIISETTILRDRYLSDFKVNGQVTKVKWEIHSPEEVIAVTRELGEEREVISMKKKKKNVTPFLDGLPSLMATKRHPLYNYLNYLNDTSINAISQPRLKSQAYVYIETYNVYPLF